MEEAALRWASDSLDHDFQNHALLAEALTHPSVTGAPSYQRLEFLGDRVLGLVIAEILLEIYPDEPEGILARRFVRLVRKETLADKARELGAPAHIELDHSARQTGVHRQDGVCADVMEALIAALYLDGGMVPAARLVKREWRSLLDQSSGAVKDAKTRLQEWAQARSLGLPRYEIVSASGPDHAPSFTVQVEVRGLEPATGSAGAKRDAQMAAAAALLEAIMQTKQGPRMSKKKRRG